MPHTSPRQPGREAAMAPRPKANNPSHTGSAKLTGKVAIITGGDSGIGRAAAIALAKEGADIVVSYLNEHQDAAETARQINMLNQSCLLISGDIGDEKHCKSIVAKTMNQYGRLDILINNAGEQSPQESVQDITAKQLERTFRTNVYSMFFLTQAALQHLKKGSAIVNTASVTAYKGHPVLIDYSATKGAVIGFTRSLALSLAKKAIRVNAIAPGPIWTPLIPSTFPPDKVKKFGKDTPLGRPGQPEEVALAYVYLASNDSSYVTGQTIHVNGGALVTS